MNIHKTVVPVGDKEIELEIGRFAEQANAAVLARMGDTVVHATVTMSRARDDISWFPLQVEYQEKLYAGGKIKGSRWVKRSGRPSDDVILKARIIDRSIRPLFPNGFKNETQVVVTVLSADEDNDADMVAMFAVAAGLSLSDIPWEGPMGGVRIGIDSETNKLIVNPTFSQRETSDLDLVVSGTDTAVVMVEAGANEVSEAKMLEAFELADSTIKKAIESMQAFVKKHRKEKAEFTPVELDQELVKKITQDAKDKIPEFVDSWAKLEDFPKSDLVDQLFEKYQEEYTTSDISDVIDKLMKQEARRRTIEDGVRPDGRKTDEIRDLTCDVGLLPRTHGSGMFKRGSTQGLTVTTLGSPSLNQLIESMVGEEEEKRYIHHYYMPPFSVGETGRMGWPSRREIGHGALAERALEPMIPSEEDFPYTIHVVSELMSSNGSTSMASVCGSTLSLMDAGVPIKKPVSGIAMGLLEHDGEYTVLTDIQGLEDHTGDMDFKVAGTADGITALQMDIKISGIPMPILKKALEQARQARLHILEAMLATISEPRASLSPYAPKIITITIPVEKIGEVIGPSGKTIKAIIAETEADIDIKDDGKVFISSVDEVAMNKAKEWVENLVREVELGEEFEGEVVRIENYGAFVNLIPGKDGLLHVSNMSVEYVDNINSQVSLGDKIKVRVNEIDDQGRIGLTTLTPEQEKQKKEAAHSSHGGGGRSRHSGGGERRGRYNRDRGRRSDRRSRDRG